MKRDTFTATITRIDSRNVLMVMAYAMKDDDLDTLIDIHDHLMVSDIELAYNTLIVMLELGDNRKMYDGFVPATTYSLIDSKGIYRRCLGALPMYPSYCGKEFYPDFAKDILEDNTKRGSAEEYKEYVRTKKFSKLITKILDI